MACGNETSAGECALWRETGMTPGDLPDDIDIEDYVDEDGDLDIEALAFDMF
jgi:hypothetical protein